MESLLRVSDDRSEAQLQPDILLPCQLGDGLFGGARLQPEKRLQLAVLEDAILTFERSVGVDGARPRRLLAEVDVRPRRPATPAPPGRHHEAKAAPPPRRERDAAPGGGLPHGIEAHRLSGRVVAGRGACVLPLFRLALQRARPASNRYGVLFWTVDP